MKAKELNAKALMSINNYLYSDCKDTYLLEELLDELLQGQYDLDKPLKRIDSLKEAEKILNGELEYEDL